MANAMKLALVLALATAFVAATAFTLDEDLQPVQSVELMQPQPIGPPKSPIETDWTLFRPQQQQQQQPGVRPQPGGLVRPRPPQPQPQLRPQQVPSGSGSAVKDKDIVDQRPMPRPQPNEEMPWPMPGAFMPMPAQLEDAAHFEQNYGGPNSPVYPGIFKKEPIDMVNGVEVPKPKYPHGARP